MIIKGPLQADPRKLLLALHVQLDKGKLQMGRTPELAGIVQMGRSY
jgi:hypothetical protein